MISRQLIGKIARLRNRASPSSSYLEPVKTPPKQSSRQGRRLGISLIAITTTISFVISNLLLLRFHRGNAVFPNDKMLRHTSAVANPETNLENQSNRLAPNLCFLHVGKTGGLSIVTGMQSLMENGHLGGAVQLHDSLWFKDFVWDAQLGKYKGGKKNVTSQNSSNVRHFRSYPLTNNTRAVECTNMGNVVTWIRDPVSRFISIWSSQALKSNNLIEMGSMGNYTATDLEFLIRNMQKAGPQRFWEEIIQAAKGTPSTFLNAKLMRFKNQWAGDISFYFGDNNQGIPARELKWEDRSKSCKATLHSLPLVFVGRSEYMVNDWKALLKLLPPGAEHTDLPHTHKSSRVGKKLSKGSIEFIRSLYSADYECIAEMVEMGLVERSYLQYILSNEREYTF